MDLPLLSPKLAADRGTGSIPLPDNFLTEKSLIANGYREIIPALVVRVIHSLANPSKSTMAAKHFHLSYNDLTIPGYYPVSCTALLLLDYHVSFVKKQGGVSAPAALSIAANFTRWARTQGIEVIHCPVDLTLSPFPTCKNNTKFASIVETLRTEGGGGEEAPELAATDMNDEKVFAKRPGHVSSFKAEGLESYLRDRGIASLLIAGLSTSGCVLRTAAAACDAEFVVTVIEDACADPAEGVHEFTCKHLLTNRGYVVTARQFKEWFGKTGQQVDLDS